uniref:STAS/SEC14 domain-containing protein n=1 Tax=Dechloromonas aromatica (strain RCB) TaxID=159087 RepID=Q47FG6_DECAR
MGYEIKWVPPDGVIKRHFGQVTGSELIAAVAKTEGDARFDTLRYVINDFLDCTGLTASSTDVEEIAAIDKSAASINPYIRIAIVATLPEVVAIANAYMNDPFNIYTTRLFSAMDEAKSWLSCS